MAADASCAPTQPAKSVPKEAAEAAVAEPAESQPSKPWSPAIVWYNVVTLALWHLGAAYGVALLLRGQVASSIFKLAVILWWASGLGITAGAHRLWAHKAYKEARVLQAELSKVLGKIVLVRALLRRPDVREAERKLQEQTNM